MSGKLELGSYEIDLTNQLGMGTFGIVYPGKHKTRGTKVAVKKCEIKTDEHGSSAMVEIKNFQQLDGHPNIVHLFDFHYRDTCFWMIMEFCDSGNLDTYMRRTNPDTRAQLDIMLQCAGALAFMHTREQPIVHRDVKPDNIMMTTDKGKVVVKVTDFGLAKISDAPDLGHTILFSTQAGTPGFMAPEFFNKEPYTKSVDVFALGLVFISMVNFKKGDARLLPVVKGKYSTDRTYM